MRVVVLGAGFAGLELSTTADAVFHPYRDAVKPGVQFVQASIQSIDAANTQVVTSEGAFEGDVLVVALGADLDPGATPGLVEDGYEFYTEAGAFALRDVLAAFDGGRVIVGVTRPPFKCPPAPSEAALLVHELLVTKGVRDRSDVSLVMPLPVPIPPSPDASRALLTTFAERNINWVPNNGVRALEPERHVAILTDDTELPYDLFLAIPIHVAPPVVVASGLTVDGWIPVDPATLETSFPDVYAVGDVTSVGTPKAGVFSEGQARVVADAIVARHRGGDAATYSGRGICYIEFGDGQVGKVEAIFVAGQTPTGEFESASLALMRDKAAFGAERIRRWFGREWSNV